jgi:hypothetical protein
MMFESVSIEASIEGIRESSRVWYFINFHLGEASECHVPLFWLSLEDMMRNFASKLIKRARPKMRVISFGI